MTTTKRIILASASPARRELMKELGIPFECHTSDYEENMAKYKDPVKLAKFLALEKGRFIAHKFPNSVIISADTFVTVNDQKIGKPKSKKEAKEIIKKMSNHHVKVHSGLAVIKTNKNGKITGEKVEHVLTKVSFTRITDKDINHIIKTDEVLAKSGAFSIEGEGGKFVDIIEGDYHNVIGLPLFQLRKMLGL